MLQIHKDLLLFDDGIKERLDFICKYANKEVTFYNGNIITLNGTNLHYIKHLDRLRKYCKVDSFTGTMDFDKGKIDHIMPYDYDYVRILPDEKVKYD